MISNEQQADLLATIQPEQIWWTWQKSHPERFKVLYKEDNYFYVTRLFGRVPERWYVDQFAEATQSQAQAYVNCIDNHYRIATNLNRRLGILHRDEDATS